MDQTDSAVFLAGKMLGVKVSVLSQIDAMLFQVKAPIETPHKVTAKNIESPLA